LGLRTQRRSGSGFDHRDHFVADGTFVM
jgi:hypothetical protein